MQRLGLFGGTFNPPTRAHETVARIASEELGLDGLFIVVNNIPRHKQLAERSPGAWERFEMCRAMCEGHSSWEAVDWELVRGGESLTYDTLQEFERRYPDAERWFIVGADSARSMPTWEGACEFHELAKVAVVPRTGELAPNVTTLSERLSGLDMRVLSASHDTLSSTLVRASLAAGQFSSELFSPDVAELIEASGWYR